MNSGKIEFIMNSPSNKPPANKKSPALRARDFAEVGGGVEPPYTVLQTAT